MNITNETIIKAAKAAGLDATLGGRDPLARLWVNGKVFEPIHNDTDNAMIRRGAEIDVVWRETPRVSVVRAAKDGIHFNIDIGIRGKAQAEREAVILCAAEKWRVMQGSANEKL